MGGHLSILLYNDNDIVNVYPIILEDEEPIIPVVTN
jgi:hypothetical protein